MIYNMVTLTTQLLLIGFAVGVVSFYLFPRGRSSIFLLELALAILGAFLGTLGEVLIRTLWTLPLVYHLAIQFLVPLAGSIVTLVVYRLANSFRD